jgi:hypothetical protein
VLRGCLLAGTSAALAVAAHGLAGGGLPDAGLTVLLTLGVAGAGIALADRRRGGPAILLALGASHLGMHLILSLAMQESPLLGGVRMLAAHLIGVLAAGWLLTRAERALFLLVTAVLALVPGRPPTAPPPLVSAGPTALGTAPVDRALAVLLTRAAPRRGPPARG